MLTRLRVTDLSSLLLRRQVKPGLRSSCFTVRGIALKSKRTPSIRELTFIPFLFVSRHGAIYTRANRRMI
jgi:hypothetical protein